MTFPTKERGACLGATPRPLIAAHLPWRCLPRGAVPPLVMDATILRTPLQANGI